MGSQLGLAPGFARHRLFPALLRSPLQTTLLFQRRQFATQPDTPSEKQPPLLPPQTGKWKGKLTAVMDLDDCLVHTEFSSHQYSWFANHVDFVSKGNMATERMALSKKRVPDLELTFELGSATETAKTFLRPGLPEFLRALQGDFEVVIWAESPRAYAEQVLQTIDPHGDLIQAQLFGEHLTDYEGFQVKDLSRLERPEQRIVLMDDSAAACLLQPNNALLIPGYMGDDQDRALVQSLQLLRRLSTQPDVRPVLQDMFGLEKSMEERIFSMLK